MAQPVADETFLLLENEDLLQLSKEKSITKLNKIAVKNLIFLFIVIFFTHVEPPNIIINTHFTINFNHIDFFTKNGLAIIILCYFCFLSKLDNI